MRAKGSLIDKESGVRKKVAAKRVTRGSVLRMLAAAEKSAASGAVTPSGAEGGGADAVADFLTTGRTGRRNAMPDILGSHANVSVGDLPDCLGKLSAGSEATTPCTSTAATPSNPFGPSTSRASDPAPSGPTSSPGPTGSSGSVEPSATGLPGPGPDVTKS